MVRDHKCMNRLEEQRHHRPQITCPDFFPVRLVECRPGLACGGFRAHLFSMNKWARFTLTRTAENGFDVDRGEYGYTLLVSTIAYYDCNRVSARRWAATTSSKVASVSDGDVRWQKPIPTFPSWASLRIEVGFCFNTLASSIDEPPAREGLSVGSYSITSHTLICAHDFCRQMSANRSRRRLSLVRR
jgi:hypothetical protein